jgi:hypothetical protein
MVLVAGLSPPSPGFAHGAIHVGFVMDKVALGQVLSPSSSVFPVSIIPPSLSILIYLGMNNMSTSGSSSET